MEEPSESLCIGLLRLPKACRRQAAKEEREQRPDASQAHAITPQRFLETLCMSFDLGVDVRSQLEEGGLTSRHDGWVARQRPGLVDRAGGRHQFEQLDLATVCADRKAAPDDFAQNGQVGPHAKELLRAAGCNAEAGDHLVKNEQSACAIY